MLERRQPTIPVSGAMCHLALADRSPLPDALVEELQRDQGYAVQVAEYILRRYILNTGMRYTIEDIRRALCQLLAIRPDLHQIINFERIEGAIDKIVRDTFERPNMVESVVETTSVREVATEGGRIKLVPVREVVTRTKHERFARGFSGSSPEEQGKLATFHEASEAWGAKLATLKVKEILEELRQGSVGLPPSPQEGRQQVPYLVVRARDVAMMVRDMKAKGEPITEDFVAGMFCLLVDSAKYSNGTPEENQRRLANRIAIFGRVLGEEHRQLYVECLDRFEEIVPQHFLSTYPDLRGMVGDRLDRLLRQRAGRRRDYSLDQSSDDDSGTEESSSLPPQSHPDLRRMVVDRLDRLSRQRAGRRRDSSLSQSSSDDARDFG